MASAPIAATNELSSKTAALFEFNRQRSTLPARPAQSVIPASSNVKCLNATHFRFISAADEVSARLQFD
jgi:hypothetical protein